MDYPTLQLNNQRRRSIYQIVANLSFFIFLFFAFFNTGSPFQEKITDVEKITTSNVVNQIVYSLLFLMSTFSLIPKKNHLLLLIKREVFLTLFFLWCLLSVVWSDFSFVAFKRLFQFFTIIVVAVAVLLHNNSLKDILKHFKLVLSPYVIITFLSVIFIPGATDPSTGTWRGLTNTKNLLGQAALVNIIFWYIALRLDNLPKKIFSLSMLTISIILLLGSQSMTSIVAFMTLIAIGVLFSLEKKLFYRLGVGNTFSIVVFIATAAIIVCTYFSAPDILQTLPQYVGKEGTFTGRTELWMDIFSEAKKHLLIGCGFASFWVIGNPALYLLYEKYIWLPNQAHMGYLDILNEMGLVGLSLFFLMIIFYFINLARLKTPHFWKWFFIAALIINIQESTFFKPRHPSGMMLIFSYLALYVELVKQKLHQYGGLN